MDKKDYHIETKENIEKTDYHIQTIENIETIDHLEEEEEEGFDRNPVD